MRYFKAKHLRALAVFFLTLGLFSNVEAQPQLPILPPVTAAPVGEGQIGVRVVNGFGQFYNRTTGATFVPRGNSYIRLANTPEMGGEWHSTFTPGLYNAVAVEAALAQMQSNHYNVVRVFLDYLKVDAPSGSPPGLNPAYMANVADFLTRAKNHGLRTILTHYWLPVSYWPLTVNKPKPANVEGNMNQWLLHPGWIDGYRYYLADVTRDIKSRGLETAVFSYEPWSEASFSTNEQPFSLTSGTVEPPSGGTYDLSNAVSRQAMADAAAVYWANQLTSAIKEVSPEAMVTLGVITPHMAVRTGYDGGVPPNGWPLPLRVTALSNSSLDYLDLHIYSRPGVIEEDFISAEALQANPAKPIVMGEFGAFKPWHPDLTNSSLHLRALQVASCRYRVSGWLLWTWDTFEQPDVWNALESGGMLNGVLSPVARPDSCSASGTPSPPPVPGDYNEDRKSDLAVWRPSDGTWYLRGIATIPWGTSTDIPVPGDYNGDGKSDIAVWRPSDAKWYLHELGTFQWGVSSDIPVPGDYNGDHQTDLAVFRPSESNWYIIGMGTFQFGGVGDIPVPGDYNGDGKTDIAVWRPSDSSWQVYGIGTFQFGGAGDIPVPGDYNGDGKTDIAVWRPSESNWYIYGIGTFQFGGPGDIPTPGDYNGDGKTDIAVWKPSDGNWYIYGIGTFQWGLTGDVPVVNSVTTVMEAARLVNNAKFISQTVPTTMTAGADVPVSITLLNTGMSTWSDPLSCGTAATDCGYRLGEVSTPANQWVITRVSVTPPGDVYPGMSRTFNFTVKAPETAGSANFQWKMVRERVEWFGEITPNISIHVTAAPLPPDRFSCNASGSCVLDSNGPFTTSNCDNSCVAPPHPTPPDLSGLDGRTFNLQDELTLNYSGTATGFNWEFISLASGQAPATTSALSPSSGHPAGAPVLTTSPRFRLGSLSLTPGMYTVRVQAVNGTQASSWASATITLTSADLASVRVFPNPLRSARGDQHVTFDQMPAGSTVKLFTVSGQWVKTLAAPAGAIDWDITNDGGERVASGIYLYLVTDTQGNKTRGKLTLIR